ncbi:hypothetical protein NEIELOOT_02331 [Neisseria elongata subsp. glycolytica ATCC 29315]|uniref:Uncharacterized protein n=1 Tax=Neisseria elongata subsp. glycolytica ATCC 29315 TaxID=546263 RepID=D4DTC6_NEIEG|nr:hypothetical protein NEIELOOT_02331 [Neisseria elongata subsp. glycolytica ATCC 29315]
MSPPVPWFASACFSCCLRIISAPVRGRIDFQTALLMVGRLKRIYFEI